MKRAILVGVVVIGLSCLIDRRSSELECTQDADCADLDNDRVCTNKLCLPLTCPPACNSCDAGRVCTINCNQPNDCRNGVSCPSGFNCRFNCNASCTPVTCTAALSCTVMCAENQSCGPIICGTASPCMCSGSGCL